MRKVLIGILVFCFSIPLFAQRPKVGLVLCGGGAKGAAHVGVIKVLEEYDIPIDYVVGTSMGAIIGGMYSIGYSGNDLDSIVLAQDWDYIMSGEIKRDQMSYDAKQVDEHLVLKIPFKIQEEAKDSYNQSVWFPENSGTSVPTSIYRGQNIFSLLSDFTAGYHGYMNFDSLPIPFSCVGVDLISSKEVVFRNGILPLAIRASMSIPGVFAPVQIDDQLFIDGGFRNNYPVDVAREMGADIIIGVKLGHNDTTHVDLNNPLDLADAVISVTTHIKTEENIEATDLLIAPTVGEYGVMSFSLGALKDLISYGEKAAREKKDELLAIKRLVEESDNSIISPSQTKDLKTKVVKDSLVIASIKYNGVSAEEFKVLERIAKIKLNEPISRNDISEAIKKYYATNAYSSVTYVLENEMSPYNLEINYVKKMSNQVGIAMRADTEEVISALLDLRLNYMTLYGSKFAIKARISQNYGLDLKYTYKTKSIFEANVTAGLRSYSSYISENRWCATFSYLQNNLGAYLSTGNSKNINLTAGVELDYFDFPKNLQSFDDILPDSYDCSIDNNGFFHIDFGFNFDNLDNNDFAQKGALIQMKYLDYFDLYSLVNKFSVVEANYQQYISFGKESKSTFIPFIKGRAIFGEYIPMAYTNMLASNASGRYMRQQLSVFGLNQPFVFDKFVAVAGIDYRQQLFDKHFISLGGNYVTWGEDIKSLCGKNNFWGFRAQYAYNLNLFPVAVNLNWSTYTKKVGLYLSIGYWF